MIDVDKMHKVINEKCMDIIRQHGRIVDDEIKKVLTLYDCKPSQIELEVHPEFTYTIKIKANEFKFDYNFKVELSND